MYLHKVETDAYCVLNDIGLLNQVWVIALIAQTCVLRGLLGTVASGLMTTGFRLSIRMPDTACTRVPAMNGCQSQMFMYGLTDMCAVSIHANSATLEILLMILTFVPEIYKGQAEYKAATY